MEYLSLGLIVVSCVLVILSFHASKKAKELIKQAEDLKKKADINLKKIEDLNKRIKKRHPILGEWIYDNSK